MHTYTYVDGAYVFFIINQSCDCELTTAAICDCYFSLLQMSEPCSPAVPVTLATREPN